jgi:tetratricopeptide (TPR) repeat protein
MTGTATSPVITTAIVFIQRPAVRQLVRDQLKELGIPDVVTVIQTLECIKTLKQHEKALLILEGTQDIKSFVTVLKAAQGLYSADTRPIFTIGQEITNQMISIAAEYNVARVQTNQVSKQSIRSHLQAIVDLESDVTSMRSILVQVADLQAMGEFSDAEEKLNTMVKTFENHPRPYAELINNLIHLDHWDQAFATAETMRKKFPDDLRMMHLYGRCLMKQKRFKEAKDFFSKANLVNPFNSERLVHLGYALLKLQEIPDAKSNFSAAIQLDETNSEAISGFSICAMVEGDVNEALKLMKEISTPREMAALFNDAAIIAIHREDFDTGLMLYNTAIGIAKNEKQILARLYYNKGLAFHKWQRTNEALLAFKLASEVDSSFEKAIHNVRIISRNLTHTMQSEASFDQGAARNLNGLSPTQTEAAISTAEEYSQDFEDESI